MSPSLCILLKDCVRTAEVVGKNRTSTKSHCYPANTDAMLCFFTAHVSQRNPSTDLACLAVGEVIVQATCPFNPSPIRQTSGFCATISLIHRNPRCQVFHYQQAGECFAGTPFPVLVQRHPIQSHH